MTIRKGDDWGAPAECPDGLTLVHDDAEAFAVLNAADPPAALGLLGGDLARTVGAPGNPARLAGGAEAVTAPIDLVLAIHDHGTQRFIAHAVARRTWWRGPLVGVFNAQYRGHWDVVPRSHPNDGWLDVIEVAPTMGVRQRWAARSRLAQAMHVPHPAIANRRVREQRWTFERPMHLELDGVDVGRTRHLEVRVVPDALTIWF